MLLSHLVQMTAKITLVEWIYLFWWDEHHSWKLQALTMVKKYFDFRHAKLEDSHPLILLFFISSLSTQLPLRQIGQLPTRPLKPKFIPYHVFLDITCLFKHSLKNDPIILAFISHSGSWIWSSCMIFVT